MRLGDLEAGCETQPAKAIAISDLQGPASEPLSGLAIQRLVLDYRIEFTDAGFSRGSSLPDKQTRENEFHSGECVGRISRRFMIWTLPQTYADAR